MTEGTSDGKPSLDAGGVCAGPAWGWRGLPWVLCGLLVAALLVVVVLAARRDAAGEPAARSVPLTIVLYVAAGAAYLAACALSPRGGKTARTAAVILVFAAAIRAAMWFAPAIPRADYNRYLWDGAVTASGRNPYRHSPRQVMEGRTQDPELLRLSRRGRAVLEEISHGELRTIYPPFAQGLFAIAQRISPFDLTGWRLVLLGFDALAAGLVLSLLRMRRQPLAFWAVYLWNPLLVVETYWGGHLDLVAAALVLLLAWCLLRGRVLPAAVALAAAVGVKLWPALLVFFLIAAGRSNPRRLVAALLLLAVLLAAMAVPFATALGGADSGLATYSQFWAANDWAYRPIRWLGWSLASALNVNAHGRLFGRAILLAALLAAAAWLGLGWKRQPETLLPRMGILILLMLLLSPTLYPWYYVPLAGLVALARRPALLLWTLLLPLTYLPESISSSLWLLSIVHASVWVLLGWECLRRRRAATAGRVPAHV